MRPPVEIAQELAQQLARTATAARHARRRRPPAVGSAPATGAPPHVYYLSPDPDRPRGGIRVFYRHVDLLNQAGIPATVVHRKPGQRAAWFANDTRVAGAAEVAVTPEDLLVVPEFYSAELDRLPVRSRVVVFNQAPFYTFDAMTLEEAAVFARRPIEAILTVSDAGLRLLSDTFAPVLVHRTRPVLDPGVFHPGDEQSGPRPRRIAYATNRRAQEAHQLLSILTVRGALTGWELVPIRGMTEAQVARTLRECPIFLSFSEREGFGLPPAEAMASGCYVIGYTGQGGEEFFDPAHSAPVPDSALADYVAAVERAIAGYEADPAALAGLGHAAARAVTERYSLAGLRADLLACYASLGVSVPGADGIPRLGEVSRRGPAADRSGVTLQG
ncbi:glycosyltransferase [Nocardioides sp.]|uniref:glycosyltransferase family protein n=1 Tax=Nocardioides sp. TaxID=35761 RepID=UPI0039E51428